MIWYWNKVDVVYEPHVREMFKKDSIKVIHALNEELALPVVWEGQVAYLRKRLTGAVLPSKEEPRRLPNNLNSWYSLEESEAWYQQHEHSWVSDGWTSLVHRIKVLVEYLIRSLYFQICDGTGLESDEELDGSEERD